MIRWARAWLACRLLVIHDWEEFAVARRCRGCGRIEVHREPAL